jgi:hypothetical protein
VQHLDRLVHVLGQDEAGAHVLGGAGDAGVAGVEVQIPRLDHVPGHHGALKEMDVVQLVDQARQVVEIGHGRLPVGPGLDVDNVDRRARGAEMDLLAPGLQVVARIEAVEHETPRGLGQGVLDQGPGKQQAAVVVEPPAGGGHQLDAGGYGVGQSDLLQSIQRRLVDALHLGIGQGSVAAPIHARLDRPFLGRDRSRAQLPTRRPATAPTAAAIHHVHPGPPSLPRAYLADPSLPDRVAKASPKRALGRLSRVAPPKITLLQGPWNTCSEPAET